MRDVKTGKFGKKNQGQGQAARKGRLGRRAARMNGDNSSESKKPPETNIQ